MTGRAKVEAAFSPEGTPEIPAVICYSGIFYRDHFAELTDQPWWVLHSGDMQAHLKAHRDRIRRVPQDWFSLPTGPSYYERKNIVIEQRADGVYRVDRKTGQEEKLDPPKVSGRFIELERAVPGPQTREQVDAEVPLPAPDETESVFRDGRAELTRILLESDARDLFPILSVASPLWGCIGLWPFPEFMMKVVDEPELIRHTSERRAERVVRTIRRLARLGARGIWIEECWLDLISPEQYRRLNLPYLRRITEAIRTAGMFSIHYYCGNPNDRLELLLDSGADALSLEESKKTFRIDVEELAQRINGRMALLGNLDAIFLLAHGSESELRAEIARQIAAGRRNRSRFVMSLGSPVTPDTSVERVKLYCDLVHELGERG